MHLETKYLKELSKNERDRFFVKIGIEKNKLESVRKLPTKKKLIEATKLALKIDPTANEDFIELIAGYDWRGVVHHHFDNLDALLTLAKKTLPHDKNSVIYKNSSGNIDILRILPSKINNLNLYYDINGNEIHVWQKDKGRIRKIILKREIGKNIFLVGISLYAGEGTKSKAARGVELVNSNFSLIRTFIRFLSELGIKRDELKARVYLHEKDDIEFVTKLWMENTGLTRDQFKKPLIKKNGYEVIKKTFTLDLRFYNSMLKLLLLYWISNFEKMVGEV